MRVIPKPKHDWYVVKVDWDETCQKKAREEGKYHLIWYIRHKLDSQKKPTAQCRFWPEVHEKNDDGSLGRMRMISPPSNKGVPTRPKLELLRI